MQQIKYGDTSTTAVIRRISPAVAVPLQADIARVRWSVSSRSKYALGLTVDLYDEASVSRHWHDHLIPGISGLSAGIVGAAYKNKEKKVYLVLQHNDDLNQMNMAVQFVSSKITPQEVTQWMDKAVYLALVMVARNHVKDFTIRRQDGSTIHKMSRYDSQTGRPR